MEEHKTSQDTSTYPSSIPTKTSDRGDTSDPHPPPAPEEEDAGKTREPKKRKSCPSDLDKCEALIKKKSSPLNSSYSFTFDTKSCGGSGFINNNPESTPKFGSFNSDLGTVIKRKDEEEGKEDEVELESTKAVSGSVEGERKREEERESK